MINFVFFKEVILYKPKTSNPTSTEFYLIGISFKGCNESFLEKIAKKCDYFKENLCIFDKKDIPEVFSNQVINFINNLTEFTNNHLESQNILYLSINDPNFYKYQYLLSEDFKFKILNRRYKEWLIKNGFNINNYKATRLEKKEKTTRSKSKKKYKKNVK